MHEILTPNIVDHFDIHPLVTRPVYVDNARPHHAHSDTVYAAERYHHPLLASHESRSEPAWARQGQPVPQDTEAGPTSSQFATSSAQRMAQFTPGPHPTSYWCHPGGFTCYWRLIHVMSCWGKSRHFLIKNIHLKTSCKLYRSILKIKYFW